MVWRPQLARPVLLSVAVVVAAHVAHAASTWQIEDEAVVASALKAWAERVASERGADAPVRLVPTDGALPDLVRQPGKPTWRVRWGGEWYDTYDATPDDARARLLPSMFPPNAAEAAGLRLERTMRVLPHMQDSGGFFIAMFEKMPTAEGAPAKPPAAAAAAAVAAAASAAAASTAAAPAAAPAAM